MRAKAIKPISPTEFEQRYGKAHPIRCVFLRLRAALPEVYAQLEAGYRAHDWRSAMMLKYLGVYGPDWVDAVTANGITHHFTGRCSCQKQR